jgi:regulator of replication initiation timing
MTNVEMFDELPLKLQLKLRSQVKNLKARIKDLIEINKSHQSMNGRLKRDLNTEKKNHDITREDNQALNLLIKKLEKRLTPNVAR